MLGPPFYWLNLVTFRGRVLIHDDLLRNDVDNQCVGRGHVEAPWLSNDLNIGVSREILIQGGIDNSANLVGDTGVSIGRRVWTFKNVNLSSQKSHRPLQTGVQHHRNQGSHRRCPTGPSWTPTHSRRMKPINLLNWNGCHSEEGNRPGTHPDIKHTASVSDGLGVSVWVGASAADVEADTNHVEAQLLGPLQKSSAGLHRYPKLHAQATHRLRVVGGDAQNQPVRAARPLKEMPLHPSHFRRQQGLLGVVVAASHFQELHFTIEGHHLDSVSRRVFDLRNLLARVGVDDVAGIHS